MKKKTLFLCTGNSARSQMAEGFLRHMAGDKFEVFSAGVKPTQVNPLAIKVMQVACWLVPDIWQAEPPDGCLSYPTKAPKSWSGIYRPDWDCTCRPFWGQCNIRRGIHDVHNDNFFPLVYTLEVEINVLDFNPRYPKNPQTLGEKLRKARMDRRITLKETAALFGVSDTAVLNWEIRGKMPQGNRMERVKEFLEGSRIAKYLDNNVHLLYIVHCLVNIKKGRTLCDRTKR